MSDSRNRLTIDFTNLMAAGVAECGLSESDLDRWAGPAQAAVTATLGRRKRGDDGYLAGREMGELLDAERRGTPPGGAAPLTWPTSWPRRASRIRAIGSSE